jgi:CDGSH-type Zn-finger protein
MPDPIMADKRPSILELQPGKTYWWCACGRSQNQPFCDGSHAKTDFSPIEFRVDTKKNFALCRCKRTADSPWCDGTHSGL